MPWSLRFHGCDPTDTEQLPLEAFIIGKIHSLLPSHNDDILAITDARYYTVMLSNKSHMMYPHVNHVGTGTLPPANMIYFFTDDRNKITENDLSGNSHYAGIGKRHVLLLHEWHFPVTNNLHVETWTVFLKVFATEIIAFD